MKKLLIYNPTPSFRLSYIFNLIFDSLIGIGEVEETTNLLFFEKAKGIAKINYSYSNIENSIFFIPDTFMLENSIRAFRPKIELHEDQPASFFHYNNKAVFPFDVFAFCFYLVSRYEEYFATETDEHLRFTAHQSMAYQHGFLDKPIVNIWANKIAVILKKKYPQLRLVTPKYSYRPSYDIDYAFAFLQKGFMRQTGAFLRNLKNKDYETLSLQIKTWLRIEKDPYFVFDYLQSLDAKFDLKPIYFWLVGDHGKFDKNIHYKNKIFRNLIAQNAIKFPIGIHPSYASNQSVDLLKKEIKRLENITKKEIKISRQHYLKLHFPTTYQNLINCNIAEDYTMGYAEELGFRASIAMPFYWFDLECNRPTKLLVHPFQIMDVTLNSYLKLTPKEAINKINPIIENTKAVNGQLISIWHNSSLCEAWNWKEWRAVYEHLISQ